ncbi:MAG: calcium-binding protein [Alphaproteobacteria bacterium]|nr:MAG: calcium-binding protein [Alphaproteobacteria bacterium]
MQTDSESFELIIILALVAVFILFQLRRTLGKKTGFDPADDQNEDHNRNPYEGKSRQDAQMDEDNVVQFRPDMDEPDPVVNLGLSKSSPFYDRIMEINQFDRSFNVRSFYDGAEYAYGLILSAFWDQDRKTLRSMLSRQVFDQFDGAIDSMASRKVRSENKLMDIEKIDLVEVSLTGSLAEVTVEFTSHMIMATRDADDKIIEGNVDKTIQVTDIWTFCRDVKSADPNWTLVATRTD